MGSKGSAKTSLGRPKEKIHEIIQKKAFELFQKRGGAQGNAWSDWFEAEKQVKEQLQSDISKNKS